MSKREQSALEKVYNEKEDPGVVFDEDGHEVPDPRKPEVPLGFRKPESLQEQIRRLIRTEFSRKAQEAGNETFEEADDFEVGDDYDPRSPYEEQFEPVDPPEVKAEIEARSRNRRKSAAAPKPEQAAPEPKAEERSQGSGDKGPQDK